MPPSPVWLNLPNCITLARLALIPVFVWLSLNDRAGWALICFVTASVSDGLDGLLARVLNQRSKVGAVLDPIADKLLVMVALVLLVTRGPVPFWLIGMILFRDASMIVGALVVRRKHLEIPTSPTRIGKYATFSMFLLVVMALYLKHRPSDVLAGYTLAVAFIAAMCIGISTVQYFARFGYLLFAPARKEGASST